MEKPNYYSIIPADVRYDTNLTPNAKLLYAEITALTNMNGYCFATNDYFAKLYNVSKVSISKWVKNLIDCGYIESEINYKEGTKEIDNRYIRIVNHPIKEKFNTPIKEKFKDNNNLTDNNNNNIIYNNNKEHKKINEILKVAITDQSFFLSKNMPEYKHLVSDLSDSEINEIKNIIYDKYRNQEIPISIIQTTIRQFNQQKERK